MVCKQHRQRQVLGHNDKLDNTKTCITQNMTQLKLKMTYATIYKKDSSNRCRLGTSNQGNCGFNQVFRCNKLHINSTFFGEVKQKIFTCLTRNV